MSPENNGVLARFVPHRGKLVATFLALVMFMAAAIYVMIDIGPEALRNGSGLGRLVLWAALLGCPVFAADALARIVRRTPTVVAVEEGLVLRSVLEARKRVMVEVNVPADKLEAVIAVLPCMREPTVSPLHGNTGFAVKAAVPRDQLARTIPEIKAKGGSDVVVTALAQIVP